MKSWGYEEKASRGLSRTVLFRKSAFVASRARHRSRRGQSSSEKTRFSSSTWFARGRRTAQNISGRAPLVLFLLKKPQCARGRRRNRVADRRGVRFPRVRVGEGLGGTFLVLPPLWPSFFSKACAKNVSFSSLRRFPPALALGCTRDARAALKFSHTRGGVTAVAPWKRGGERCRAHARRKCEL